MIAYFLALQIVRVEEALEPKVIVYPVRSPDLCFAFGSPCEKLIQDVDTGTYCCLKRSKMAQRKPIRVRESRLKILLLK